MDAVDAALVGQGPAPLILRKFILATGERGMGSAFIFGDRPLTMKEFEDLYYIQSRVMLASTDDGKKEIEQEVGIRAALRVEQNQGELPSFWDKPIDFNTATPEQVQAWMREQERLLK